jgi:hypothetical protein
MSAAAPQSLNHPQYVEPAPVRSVMVDQLHYLLSHDDGGPCKATCRDCRRLRIVTRALMRPFRELSPPGG